MGRRLGFITVLVLAIGAAGLPDVAAESRFADVPPEHLFAEDIEWLAAAGITAGCNPPTNDRFCPDRTVTRGQMAAFLARALQLPAASAIDFVDDDTSVFEDDIERLAAAGITAGCNPPANDRFCPNKPVTRDQMAAFLSRALGLTNRSGDPFRDDDGSIFEADIERLAAAGITAGCNPPANDRFCPDKPVTRAQMAAFLRRGLTNEGTDPAPIIPSSRRIDWAPGVPGGIPDDPATINVLHHGATGDGTTDDIAAFRSAVAAIGTDGGVVYIPPGRYLLGGALDIEHGVVLRGAGAEATHLQFDLGGSGRAAIDVVKYDRGNWREVSGATQGSTTITVDDATGLSAPTFAEIQQDNDPALMYTDPAWDVAWADESVGEMVLITEVAGNTLTLAEPLNTTYRSELSPAIRTMGLVEYAGVEDLHVERLDAGDGHIISFKNAAYSWVRRVKSEMAFRSHVAASSVYKCEVRDSHFSDAHDHGGGGHGYGVSLGRHTTGCLVENNTFESLRHSMIIQVGASGNVFGYNFSVDSHDNSGYLLPDISLHGHYPLMNLFEGNIVEEIGISDWWGPVGPGNTFLRNCVLVEGLFVDDHSH
nr:S-layer homology domain-containing protein [Acidimicrobiia bacterium]